MISKNKLVKTFTAFCILCSSFANAQDIHFSQYNEAPLLINPALGGVQYDLRVLGNYRNQWASVASPYKTFGFSVETAIKHKKISKSNLVAGLALYRDMAGDAKMGTTNIYLMLGGTVKAGEHGKFTSAIMPGFTMRSVSYTNLKWDSQYNGYKHDETLASGETNQANNFNYFDAAIGFNYHYSKTQQYITATRGSWMDFGVAAYHLNSPKNSYLGVGAEKLYPRIVANTNINIAAKGANSIINPSFIYMNQGPASQFNLGIMIKYILVEQSVHTTNKKPVLLGIGANYRIKDAFVPQLLLEYDKLAIGASYDFNFSTLTNVSKAQGGFEISLRYNWNPGYGKALGGSFNKTYTH